MGDAEGGPRQRYSPKFLPPHTTPHTQRPHYMRRDSQGLESRWSPTIHPGYSPGRRVPRSRGRARLSPLPIFPALPAAEWQSSRASLAPVDRILCAQLRAPRRIPKVLAGGKPVPCLCLPLVPRHSDMQVRSSPVMCVRRLLIRRRARYGRLPSHISRALVGVAIHSSYRVSVLCALTGTSESAAAGVCSAAPGSASGVCSSPARSLSCSSGGL